MTHSAADDMTEFHWMMDMIQSIDVGIVVIDSDYRVKVWNGFMESHSGLLPSDVRDKTLFELFEEVDAEWFKNKVRPVVELRNRAFITWEQRPFLFKFRNYRPITGAEDFMYQNIILSPLTTHTGQVENISIMIYDMTDVATSKKQAEATQVTLDENLERQSV